MPESFFSPADPASYRDQLLRKADRFLPKGSRPPPPLFSFGQGEYLYDLEGESYTDLSSGSLRLPTGHGDADIIEAVRDQCDKILHSSNLFYNPEAALLAQALIELTFPGKVFFCNSGNESIEAAFKLARSYGELKKEGAFGILSHTGSSHGDTLAALSASGPAMRRSQIAQIAPLLPGNIHLPENDIEMMEECLEQNGSQLCAFFVELLNSSRDMRPVEREYIERAAQLCEKHGLLLVINENYTAPARSGKLFCCQHYDLTPDLLTLGGSMGAGLPFGALLVAEEKSRYLSRGMHGSTFGGNHLACRVAYQLLRSTANDDLLSHVNVMSEYIFRRLRLLQERYSSIVGVQGKGLAIAIEFSTSSGADRARELCLQKRLLMNIVDGRFMQICPPLNISLERIATILDQLEHSLKI